MLAVGRHFVGARARMTHQPQVRGRHRVTKKSRNKKFKKISKRNLLNVGMGGWMEALAEKHTNKERTFHNIATFHTTIPT